MKAKTILAVLGKRYGVALPGMADVMPKHPTLGDVDSRRGAGRVPGRQAGVQGVDARAGQARLRRWRLPSGGTRGA